MRRLITDGSPVSRPCDWFLFCRASHAEQLFCGLATEPRWVAFAKVLGIRPVDIRSVVDALTEDITSTEDGIVYPLYEFQAEPVEDVQADRGRYLLALKDCEEMRSWQGLQEPLQKILAVLSIGTTPALAGTVSETEPDCTSPDVSPKTDRHRTPPGGARVKLIAALTKHHKYAENSCLNQEPIGCRELAKLAGTGSATHFFNHFFGSYPQYRVQCGDVTKLILSLKMMNGELRPRDVFRSKQADDIEQPDE